MMDGFGQSGQVSWGPGHAIADFSTNMVLGGGAELTGSMLANKVAEKTFPKEHGRYTRLNNRIEMAGKKNSFPVKAGRFIRNMASNGNVNTRIAENAMLKGNNKALTNASRIRNIVSSKFYNTSKMITGRTLSGSGLAAMEVAGVGLRAFGWIAAAGQTQDLTSLAMATLGLADTEGGLLEATGRAYAQTKMENSSNIKMTTGFTDTRAASTMRQRSLMAINNTQMNLSQVFGAEASAVHV